MNMQNYGTLEEVPKKLEEWTKWLRERQMMAEFCRLADVNAATISRTKNGGTIMMRVRTRRRLRDAYIQLRQEYEATEEPKNQKDAIGS